MSDHTPRRDLPNKIQLDIADEDIYAAMKEVHGYLDITTEDFHELYRFAYRHAIERLTGSIKAGDIMTAKVVTVAVGTHIDEVAGVMARHSLKAVPVVDSRRLYLRRDGFPHNVHLLPPTFDKGFRSILVPSIRTDRPN